MALNKKFGLQYEFTQGGPNIDFHRIKINYYSLNKKASLYGYHPTLSSLDLLLSEVEILLKNLNSELQ